MTTRKLRPGLGGTASSRAVIASSPPAEAPTPTTVKGSDGGTPSAGVADSAGRAVSDMERSRGGSAFTSELGSPEVKPYTSFYDLGRPLSWRGRRGARRET